ncbi:hypothetical protein ACFX2J_000152 [Malus domestica]
MCFQVQRAYDIKDGKLEFLEPNGAWCEKYMLGTQGWDEIEDLKILRIPSTRRIPSPRKSPNQRRIPNQRGIPSGRWIPRRTKIPTQTRFPTGSRKAKPKSFHFGLIFPKPKWPCVLATLEGSEALEDTKNGSRTCSSFLPWVGSSFSWFWAF